jgi:hypothetical protein
MVPLSHVEAARPSQRRSAGIEGKTDLPEGTELTLVMLDADDEMTPEERADLDAELERGRGAIAAGQGISDDELLARVREP